MLAHIVSTFLFVIGAAVAVGAIVGPLINRYIRGRRR